MVDNSIDAMMNLQLKLNELIGMIEGRLTSKVENLIEIRQRSVSLVLQKMPGMAYCHLSGDMETWFKQLCHNYDTETKADIYQFRHIQDLTMAKMLIFGKTTPQKIPYGAYKAQEEPGQKQKIR